MEIGLTLDKISNYSLDQSNYFSASSVSSVHLILIAINTYRYLSINYYLFKLLCYTSMCVSVFSHFLIYALLVPFICLYETAQSIRITHSNLYYCNTR